MRWVSRYFDQNGLIRAVTDASFDVYRGEVFGLLGPPGSGKTTVLRILAGRLAPSEGKVKVFGRGPKRRAVRSRVGYLAQHADDTHSRMVSEVCDFLKDVFWLKAMQRQTGVRAATAERKDRRGMLRQILVKNPELLLLDEPFSELEPAACDELLQLIRAFKQQGRTVILTGSSLTHTKDVCDRLAVLRRGQIEAIGTLRDLLATRAGLHYVSDLLPQVTAEGALELIRKDLDVRADPSQTGLEAPHATAPQTGAKAHPTPDGILRPLVKRGEPEVAPKVKSGPTVNHEMLAALTRKPSDDLPSRGEGGGNTQVKPDP